MTKDAFRERERALEETFFHRVDEKLWANLKRELSLESELRELAEAVGISDEKLLRELVEQGVSSKAVAAISLVPLILVAWADGKLDDKERPSILRAATEQGIGEDSSACQLLQHWLDEKPAEGLAQVWKHYVQAVVQKMSAEGRAAWRDEVVRRATAVAQSSGGFLSLGTISSEEQGVIAELEQAFGD